jgi:polyisoprenoid-binding protein YceI
MRASCAASRHPRRRRRGAATGQINRSDYEMRFNMALGSGNVVVGDKVRILLEISAVRVA